MRAHTLAKLLQSNCQGWPLTDDGDMVMQQERENDYISLLQMWTDYARKAASSFSFITSWDNPSLPKELYDLGQLQWLEPMPSILDMLVKQSEVIWDVDIRHFSDEVKSELRRLSAGTPFWTIFDFYKRVTGYESVPPPYVLKMRQARSALREQHGVCQCFWGKELVSSTDRWISTGGWPHWNNRCPYQVVDKELELRWGARTNVLSSTRASKEIVDFVQSSYPLHYAGLIHHLEYANVPHPQFIFKRVPDVWPCSKWNYSSALTPLLQAAAEFEVDSAIVEISAWLEEIDPYTPPNDANLFNDMIRLVNQNEGLSLVRWIKKKRSK
ncbi:hypothetical protein GCM10008066_06950 [Oxalicibacterium faecigallinarum]|uniref:Uncharacterized protein n=2 Tax=Oxalicibacterium faecigallinarum TaxID=573741 RepID=A0A8J3ANI0_9BURK|nr:hypothetical protein GCM10008066_06950 [Oxalicibacterium faecigallinarum]